jgi:AraC family transcriptional activator of pyochelin receptor
VNRAQNNWQLAAVSPGVMLGGGALHFTEPVESEEENASGLKLVLVMNGQLSYQFSGTRMVNVKGPAFHVSLSNEPFTITHRFDHPDPLHYLTVRMPMQHLVEQFEVDTSYLAKRLRASQADSRFIVDNKANRIVQALGQQMLNCPLQGGMRSIYLSGKALEMTAMVLNELESGEQNRTVKLGSRDIQCLYAVKDVLQQSLQSPPGLPELARLVGINVNKLTTGFRQLFQCSVYEYVRQERLALAYRMLSAGEISIAEAAHACGYTDSHFSKVFRERYGILPSALQGIRI